MELHGYSVGDEKFCDEIIFRLQQLMDGACTRALTDQTREAVSQCVSIAQQMGAWVDRRAKLSRGLSAEEISDEISMQDIPLEQLEQEFRQALEDIRHEKQLD